VLELSLWRGIEFIARGDREILRSYDDLLNYVFKQIDSLKRLVTYIADEDWELASNEAAMIGTFESLADDTQQKASLRICRGAFFSGLSEHFLELLEKIDDMADFAKDASTAATEINLRTPVFHSLLKDQDSLYNMIEEVTQSAKALKVAIESLTRGSDPVIEAILEVRKHEKLADGIREKLTRSLYAQKSDVDLLTLLQIKEFISSLDLIADAAEDSAETLLAIIAKAE
jgi:predicted phosphate transport protein (TIGR00153 family)